MKRLLLAAGMAVILHALLLGAKAEWAKTLVARKVLPEPLSISLHYQEPVKKAEVSQKEAPTLTIPTPREILATPPAPKALDAPEIPPFTVPVQAPKEKKTKVERPKPERQKQKKDVTPQVAAAENLPDDWMQIPEGPQDQVQKEAPVIASIAPVKEGAAALPESLKQAAPAPPPLVEAVPIYRKNPTPRYPRNARRRGYEGKVILEVLVNEEGSVEDLRVFESSGYQILDRVAMKSVKTWLFEPGRRGDERVEMWVKVPIRFDLK